MTLRRRTDQKKGGLRFSTFWRYTIYLYDSVGVRKRNILKKKKSHFKDELTREFHYGNNNIIT